MKNFHGRGFCISFESPLITDETVYEIFYQVFSSYGKLNKQYIDYNKKSGFAYYDNKRDAENAYKSLKEKNNFFIVVSPPVPAKQSDSDVEVSPGAEYYNVFGQNVPVLTSDDGETYISLEHLKDKCGLKLFKNKEMNITKQNFEERFKWFMYNQAYIFVQMNQSPCEKYFVDNFINWIVEHATGKSQTTNSTKLQSKTNMVVSTEQSNPDNYASGNSSNICKKEEIPKKKFQNGRNHSPISVHNETKTSSLKKNSHSSSVSSFVSHNSHKEIYQGNHKKQIERNSQLLSRRSCVSEYLKGTNGILQCIDIKNEKQFIGFIFPLSDDAATKINQIENIEVGEYDENYKPSIGSTVIVNRETNTEDISQWSRAIVLRVVPNGFVVALVDFGNIMQVKKVYKISEKYNNITEFITLCTTSKEAVSLLMNNFEVEYESNENNKLSIILNKTKFEVTCNYWNPFEEDLSINKPSAQPQEIITSIKPSTEIHAGVQVKLIGESNGMLALRSFNDSIQLKKIMEEIANFKLVKLQSPPIVNQIVLYCHQNKFYRAVVIDTEGNYVTVKNIDYNTNHVVWINSLYYADSFAKRNSTLTCKYLKGYRTFSEKAKDYLQKCFNKVKFVVHSVDEETIDLMYEKDYLSDIIKKVDNLRSAHTMEEDLPAFKFQGDSENMMVLNTDDLHKGQLIFYPIDSTSTEDFIKVGEILESYETHAVPLNLLVGELCVAKFEEGWYRAVVREIYESNNTCLVYFLDYGNKSVVSCDDIREFSEELKHLVPMAVHCRLKDFIDDKDNVPEKIFSKLDSIIQPMSILKLQVLNQNSNKVYDISIPSLAMKLFD